MAAAVIATGVLYGFLPEDFRITAQSRYIYPVFLVAFLVVLVIGDPGRIDRERRWLRVTTELMIGLITVVNAVSAVRLIIGILTRASFTDASELLTIGAIVWTTNVIAFSLWFWDLDAGGAAVRASGSNRVPPAFVFPEMSVPHLVPQGWYPQFADYLALSFNTAMAFSPTDVSAIRRWAKLMMSSESAISLVLAALVVARAINILPSSN
jgi:hypothetical protein